MPFVANQFTEISVLTMLQLITVKKIMVLTARADYEFSYFTFDFSDVVERNNVVVEMDDVTFELGDVVKLNNIVKLAFNAA